MRRVIRYIKNQIKEIKTSNGQLAQLLRPACMLLTIVLELICTIILIAIFAKSGGYANEFANLHLRKLPLSKGNAVVFYKGFPLIVTGVCTFLCLISNFVCYYMTETKVKKILLSAFIGDTAIFWGITAFICSDYAIEHIYNGSMPPSYQTLANILTIIAAIGTIGLLFLLLRKSKRGVLNVIVAAALGFVICPLLTLLAENPFGSAVLLALYIVAKFYTWKRLFKARQMLREAGYSKEVIRAVTRLDKKTDEEKEEISFEEKQKIKEQKAKAKAEKKRDKATKKADKHMQREKVGLDFLDRSEIDTVTAAPLPSSETSEAVKATESFEDKKPDNRIYASEVPNPLARKIDCDAENGLEVRQGISPLLEEEVDVYARNWMGAATKLCTLEEFKDGRAEIYYKGMRIMNVKAPDFPF